MFKPKLLDVKEDGAVITEKGKGFLMEFPEDEYRPPILHVQGSPYEMGYTHGYLLADRIKDLTSISGTPVAAVMGGWNVESGKPPKIRHIKKGIERLFNFIERYQMPAIEKQVPELLEEMKGLFKGLQDRGSPITWEMIYLINCSPEPQYVFERNLGGGCSSFSAWDTATQDGKLIHGANLDFYNFDYIHKAQIVVVCKPEKGNNFLGMITAGNINPPRWLNDKFLSFSEMTSNSINIQWPQISGNMVRRMACQYASNINETYEILKTLGGSLGWNNMICEGKGADPQGVLIEISGTEIAQREEDPEFPDVIWSTNHYNCYPGWQGYEGHNMIPGQIEAFQRRGGVPIGPNQGKMISWEDVDTVDKWREYMVCPRYEKYLELLKKNFGKINLEKAAEFQGDYEMTRGALLRDLGHKEITRVELCPPFENTFGDVRPIVMEECPSTNSIVFSPSEGEAWIAAGAVPAQNGPYWKISLHEHLEMLKNYE